MRFCNKANLTFGGTNLDALDAEIKRLKDKHKRDVMYIKKNMTRKFKRALKQLEDASKLEVSRIEDSHKRAVMKVTKDWTAERTRLEDTNRYLDQENKFLKQELQEYKTSHDTQIREVERLKKYIDEIEEENDAYKEHIAAQINYETTRRENL